MDLRHVFTVTDFLRHHREHIARLQQSREPIVLTVNGRPAVVIQDADGYQNLLDQLERAKDELQEKAT